MESQKTHTLEADAVRAGATSLSCRTFPADRTAPRAAAAWLRSQPTGLSPTRLADAELCMDELVTNVVRYGWKDSDTGPRSLTLRIDRSDSEVEITVEDAGVGVRSHGRAARSDRREPSTKPFPAAAASCSCAPSPRASPTSAVTASIAPRSRFRWTRSRRRPRRAGARPFSPRSKKGSRRLDRHAPHLTPQEMTEIA